MVRPSARARLLPARGSLARANRVAAAFRAIVRVGNAHGGTWLVGWTVERAYGADVLVHRRGNVDELGMFDLANASPCE